MSGYQRKVPNLQPAGSLPARRVSPSRWKTRPAVRQAHEHLQTQHSQGWVVAGVWKNRIQWVFFFLPLGKQILSYRTTSGSNFDASCQLLARLRTSRSFVERPERAVLGERILSNRSSEMFQRCLSPADEPQTVILHRRKKRRIPDGKKTFAKFFLGRRQLVGSSTAGGSRGSGGKVKLLFVLFHQSC